MTMKAYRVKVKTTNALNDMTYGRDNGEIGSGKIPYQECRGGEVIIVTHDPKKIYNEFPLAVVIEEIGIGYFI